MDADDYRQMGIEEYRPPEGEPNDALARQVWQRLEGHERIDASRVEVQVCGDTAILTGIVLDRHARGRAEELASEVDGVGSVVNRLVVQQEESGGPTLTVRDPGSADEPSTQRS